LDAARLALLTNVVESYMKLDGQEQSQFVELVAAPGGEEVKEMISVYEERGIEKGIEQGIEKGIEQGIARGKQDTLLRQMNLKFGPLPAALREQVESVTDTQVLDYLTDRILSANTLDEMQLPQ
jgi:hypothetical protein